MDEGIGSKLADGDFREQKSPHSGEGGLLEGGTQAGRLCYATLVAVVRRLEGAFGVDVDVVGLLL